jgi:hypothetical protein
LDAMTLSIDVTSFSHVELAAIRPGTTAMLDKLSSLFKGSEDTRTSSQTAA